MTNFRDIENLSAYLDGQLSDTESKRLTTRLESDLELASVLSDLSSTRNILRKLPARKAPRNFTLTRKMVGLKPPLPRTYPLFRLATIFATLLFVFSFSVNALSPYVSFSAPQFAYGYGGGGEGEAAPAAAQEQPLTMMETAPAEEPSADQAAQEPLENQKMTEPPVEEQRQAEVTHEAVFSSNLIYTFLIISIIGAISMFVIRQNAKRKWQ
ncbi:MAG: anti-sigma factor family protein [Anaerolineales bacterium]